MGKNKKVSDKLAQLKADESSDFSDKELLDAALEDFSLDDGGGKTEVNPSAAILSSHDGGSSGHVLADEGATMVVAPEDITQKNADIYPAPNPIEEKVSYGDVYENEPQADSSNSVESVLRQSEHLRIAQDKINELELEIETLRRENDELLTAGETYKKLSEDYFEQLEKFKAEVYDIKEISGQEVQLLKERLSSRNKQLREFKQENAELKNKVETNFKHIRKRERDLEYRLELAHVEETALLKSKDKTILDLRRKVDKVTQDMDSYRVKNKEHYNQLQEQDKTVRSVVRALRLALSRLEGDFAVDLEVFKKAE